MNVVVLEQRSNQLNRASLEAVAAAQALGDPVTAVILGVDLGPLAESVQSLDLAEVVAIEHEHLGEYTADAYVAALSSFLPAASPTHVFLAHTYQTRDFVPRLAARLERPLVADCTRIARTADGMVFTRPLFQGKLHADVALEGPPPHFITIQLGAFAVDAVRRGASPAATRTVAAALEGVAIRQQPEAPFREAQQAVDLSQAERIVSIGRGIKEEANVTLARDLATALGAELAASRPICDAGWLPMDRQVGSSGQTVAPKLYIALGISGAIQHIVGMKGSRTIVAINKDPDAPIFEVATHGVVGDLFDVVPAMIAALEQA